METRDLAGHSLRVCLATAAALRLAPGVELPPECRGALPYAMGTSERKGLIMAIPTGRPIDRMSLAQLVREIERAVHVRTE